MTKINEFYLSKEGKACHINLEPSPKFLVIGLNAVLDRVDFLLEKTQSASFYMKEKYSAYKNKTSLLDINKDNIETLNDEKLKSSLEILMNDKNKKSFTLNKVKLIGLVTLSSFIASLCIYHQHQTQTQSFDEDSSLNEYVEQNVESSAHNKFLPSIFSSKLQAFIELLTFTEGKSKTFKEDNDGIMTAYGWNPTQNTKAFNLFIAQSIGMSSKEQKAIEAISIHEKSKLKTTKKPNAKKKVAKTQHVPASLKEVVLSQEQLDLSAKIMMEAYEKEFLNVVKVKSNEKNEDFSLLRKNYFSLPYNQQAVLLHMTYKVGATRLLKYDELFDTLFNYMKHPSIDNLQKASNMFEYSYITRAGERIHDVRVEQEHQSFFIDCLDDKHKVLEKIKNCKSQTVSSTLALK